jgi:hypothetical protein
MTAAAGAAADKAIRAARPAPADVPAAADAAAPRGRRRRPAPPPAPSHLLQHDALGVGSAGEGLLPLAAQVGLLEVLVRPPLVAAVDHELAPSAHTARLAAGGRGGVAGGGRRRAGIRARARCRGRRAPRAAPAPAAAANGGGGGCGARRSLRAAAGGRCCPGAARRPRALARSRFHAWSSPLPPCHAQGPPRGLGPRGAGGRAGRPVHGRRTPWLLATGRLPKGARPGKRARARG